MAVTLLALAALLAFADAWTTWRALRIPGAYEASPIGRFLIGDGRSLVRLVALKAVLVALFAYALFGHATGWVDVFRWIVVAMLFAGSAFVVVSNLKMIRGW